MSRALCMYFHKDFNGRVFHAELGTMPALELQKLVLTKLRRISKDAVDRVHDVNESRWLLKKHMRRHRVFLVIDNISKDRTEASAYLEAGFHHGSMIMITSRSRDIVKELFPGPTYCKAMPSLSEEEAGFIFLRRAAPQMKLESFTTEEQEILEECLGQGRFPSEDGERQYHPLALQALADYYYRLGKSNLLTWKDHLQELDKLRLSNASSDIFRVLGLQFLTLCSKEKLLFLDLCLYRRKFYGYENLKDVVSWLADVHEETPKFMENELQSLKRSGIINISDQELGDQFISIHDLYVEFAKWYVIDGEGSRCAELGCVYHTTPATSLPYVLKRTSATTSELRRIWLENLDCTTFPSKKVQEWRNVVVLQLRGCFKLKVLHLHGLSCLRHLSLVGLASLETFHFTESESNSSSGSNGTPESLQHVVLIYLWSLKQLPDFSLCSSLKSFRIFGCGKFISEPPSFMGCSQLEDLNLHWFREWESGVLKLNNSLTSLTSLELIDDGAYFAVLDPNFPERHCDTDPPSVLKRVELVGLDDCTQLQTLRLRGLRITSLPGLEKLTSLRWLKVTGCRFLRGIPGLDRLPNLTKVEIRLCKSLKNRPRVPLHCKSRICINRMLDIDRG